MPVKALEPRARVQTERSLELRSLFQSEETSKRVLIYRSDGLESSQQSSLFSAPQATHKSRPSAVLVQGS